MNLLYSNGDSVRQALAADFADQMEELGIICTIEGVGWDTAYDRALSEPLLWGWGAHTPMELYNIYHTIEGNTVDGKDMAQYSPYANETVDTYMDQALAESDLEEAYTLWQQAQWDGTTGVTQEGISLGVAGQYRPPILGKRRPYGGGTKNPSPRPWLVHCQ